MSQASPDGMQYDRDVAWKDSAPSSLTARRSSDILATRFTGFFPGDLVDSSPLYTASAQEDLVEEMRRITGNARVDCPSSSPQHTNKPFPFARVSICASFHPETS